jgi:capsid portal protein
MLNQQDLDFLNSRKFSRDEILAMWRVNPYVIGSVENVNLATARASRIQHAEMNVEPRIRRFVKQLNATFVSIYDPTFELGYENPVPEDIEAKLKAAREGVDKWWTKG